MAEALLRDAAGTRFEVASAGTEPRGVHPLAVRAMKEIGIDISRHTSSLVDEMEGPWDFVVTVCDSAKESCPYVAAREKQLHESFEDPSAAEGSEEERLHVFRRVRDEIRGWIGATFID